jgi:uncharacterized membrane protein
VSWYVALKTVHILSAAVIFGTGFGIAFFTWFGYRKAVRLSDIGQLRGTMQLTVTADACITAPAVALQAASGLALQHVMGWPLASAWSAAVWSLFVLAGVCWIPVLVLQVAFRREAQRSASLAALPEHFHRWFRYWFVLGVAAFAAVIGIYWLMIAKPLSPV